MCDVYCCVLLLGSLLVVVWCSLFVDRCHYLMFVVCCSIVCRLLVCLVLVVVRSALCVVRCWCCFVCCSLLNECYLLCLIVVRCLWSVV